MRDFRKEPSAGSPITRYGRFVVNEGPRRIVIIKPSALGDVIGSLPVAGLLKRRYPAARLAWVIARPFVSLLETHPHVDETIPFDRLRDGTAVQQLRSTRRLVGALREGKFDMAIDLQGLFRSGWLTWRSGARRRIGFDYAREGSPRFYNERVASRGENRNAAERYLDVAEHLGCGRLPAEADITTTPDDDAAADALLAGLDGNRFALLLPGTNWSTKRWPAAAFEQLARRLEADGLAVVVAGADDAKDAAACIGGLDIVGRTSVRELAAVMRRASLVVANDSGPMHLAAALGRPLVALFGPTDPHRTGPWRSPRSVVRLDVVCSPCFSRTCEHNTCLTHLSVDDVHRRCMQQIDRTLLTSR